MRNVKVPPFAQEQLSEDEEIIQGCGWLDGERAKVYCATDKRLLGFEGGSYIGSIKYSNISGITFKAYHPKLAVIVGLALGIPFIVLGIYFLTLISRQEAGPASNYIMGGAICISMGLFILLGLCLIKTSYYQLKIRGLSQTDMQKWRISGRWGGRRSEEAEKLSKILEEKICVSREIVREEGGEEISLKQPKQVEATLWKRTIEVALGIGIVAGFAGIFGKQWGVAALVLCSLLTLPSMVNSWGKRLAAIAIALVLAVLISTVLPLLLQHE